MSRQFYFTPDGFERLRAKIHSVRAAYQAVCDDNPAALESGDTSGWHDNFAFEDNQRQMHQLARRVRDLEELMARSEVMSPLRAVPERVMLGVVVRWQYCDDDTDAPKASFIAGFDDGDPGSNRVSYNSPLGSVLIGAEPGEERELLVNRTVRKIEVLGIELPAEGGVCLVA